jgi:hypothetical protein
LPGSVSNGPHQQEVCTLSEIDTIEFAIQVNVCIAMSMDRLCR